MLLTISQLENTIIAYSIPDFKQVWTYSFEQYDYFIFTKKRRNEFNLPIQLTIIDIQTGELILSSKIVEALDKYAQLFYDIFFYQDPFYYFISPIKGYENSALLQYNPKSNTFNSSFQIILNNKKHNHVIYPTKVNYLKDEDNMLDRWDVDYAIGVNSHEVKLSLMCDVHPVFYWNFAHPKLCENLNAHIQNIVISFL